MQRIKVSNLRGITESPWLELKPLTLVVGANSSGKSSLLRLFPVLRQSVETTTSSPILWYGSQADLGSLKSAIRRGAPARAVRLGFEIALPQDQPVRLSVLEPRPAGAREHMALTAQVVMTLALCGNSDERLAGLDIHIAGKDITLGFGERGEIHACTVGQHDLTSLISPLRAARFAHIVPSLSRESDEEAVDYVPYTGHPAALDSHWALYHGQLATVVSQTNELLEPYLSSLSDGRLKWKAADELPITTESELAAHLARISDTREWRERIAGLTGEPKKLDRLHALVLAQNLPGLLQQLDRALASFSSRVRYLGPERAKAQRYYRSQALSVNELDPRAENLAMWLRSLSIEDQRFFGSWSNQYFGFQASTTTHQEQVSIGLTDAHSHEINFADVGFGYSQILPVAAHLWSAGWKQSSRVSVLAIEQPELHLHPAMQAQVGDALVALLRRMHPWNAQAHDPSMALVVETHSETMVNRIGRAISRSQLPADAAQVILFERRSADSPTEIRVACFNEEGILQNWPFGFFRAV